MKWFFRERFSVFEILMFGVLLYLFMGNYMVVLASWLLVVVISEIVQSTFGLDLEPNRKT